MKDFRREWNTSSGGKPNGIHSPKPLEKVTVADLLHCISLHLKRMGSSVGVPYVTT